MGMLSSQKKIRLFLAVCGIYVLPVVTAILFAYFLESYPFDLNLTVSLYVAKYIGTAVLFFACVTSVCVAFFLYIKKIHIGMIQRILYFAVIVCIFGCACFPCNRSRSVLCADIHDLFSYLLVIFVSLTFLTMSVWGQQKRQKVFAIGSLLYAVGFIVAFVYKVPAIKQTIFIWENVLILLLFAELFLEDDRKAQETVE